MQGGEIALILFRLVGALWLAGGLFLIVQVWNMRRLDAVIADLHRMTGPDGAEPIEEDQGRLWWMIAGGLATALAGALMLAGLWLSIPALCLVIAHQMLYFVRQRRIELAAASAEAQEEARPARTTVNAFFFSLMIALLASWLAVNDRLL